MQYRQATYFFFVKQNKTFSIRFTYCAAYKEPPRLLILSRSLGRRRFSSRNKSLLEWNCAPYIYTQRKYKRRRSSQRIDVRNWPRRIECCDVCPGGIYLSAWLFLKPSNYIENTGDQRLFERSDGEANHSPYQTRLPVRQRTGVTLASLGALITSGRRWTAKQSTQVNKRNAGFTTIFS